MSSDDKFFVSIVGLLVAGLVAIGTILALYWADHNDKIMRLIDAGVDPVAAMCALQDDRGNHPTCIILAMKKEVSQSPPIGQ